MSDSWLGFVAFSLVIPSLVILGVYLLLARLLGFEEINDF